jgi:3-deoxy-7-phosphoheptulonate synthase
MAKKFDGSTITFGGTAIGSVVSINYVDSDGATQTLAAANYTVFTPTDGPGVIELAYNESWPSTRAVPNAVTVRFIAGYANAASVPAAVKEAGAHVLRGGVWKPRTNPYAFQGDTKSLDILMEAHRRTGLPVDAEVMDEQQLRLALDAGVHMLQVGARNALNYSLLRAIGRAVAERDTVVLLKRSLHMGPINEFLSAAEYIASFGNPNILLCPRGTAPTLDGYRNHPDESITPLLKEKTWAPVVVDPSHSVGRASYVPACALAAIAYGADGLCIETHVKPSEGIGDDPKQALTPEVLAETIAQAQQLWNLRRASRVGTAAS